MVGLLLLVSSAHADCAEEVAAAKVWFDAYAADSAAGRMQVARRPELVARPLSRAALGSHQGVVFALTPGFAEIGTVRKPPGPWIDTAISSNSTWSFGRERGIDRLVHILVGVAPETPWSDVVALTDAAARIAAPAVSFLFSDPVLAPPKPSALHDKLVALRGKQHAQLNYMDLFQTHFTACPGVGEAMRTAAGVFPHDKPAWFASTIPAAFEACACKAPPADAAELFYEVDGRDRVYAVDVQVSASGREVSLPGATPWDRAWKTLLKASERGPVHPVAR